MLSLDLCMEDLICIEQICIKGTQLVDCSVKSLTCVQCHKKLDFSG